MDSCSAIKIVRYISINTLTVLKGPCFEGLQEKRLLTVSLNQRVKNGFLEHPRLHRVFKIRLKTELVLLLLLLLYHIFGESSWTLRYLLDL